MFLSAEGVNKQTAARQLPSCDDPIRTATGYPVNGRLFRNLTEVRSRLAKLVRTLAATDSLLRLSPAELQTARALQVLVYLDSERARGMLQSISERRPETLTSRQAKAILRNKRP